MSDVYDLLGSLRERAKELNCLYEVEKALADGRRDISDVLRDVVQAIPPGWQYPEICEARGRINSDTVETPGFRMIHAQPQIITSRRSTIRNN